MSRFTMAKAVCAMVGLFGLAVLAPAQDRKDAGEALKKDAESLQGKWERAASSEAGPLARATRAVKEVKGDKETVTWYGANGEVVRSHRITFKLSQDGSVRVFTYSDPEILDGPGKGAKLTATGSYIYRLDGNELVEVGGMRAGERVAPYLARWKKVDAQAPAAGRKAVVVEGDMKAAQGVWTFDSQEAGGVRIPADPLKELTLTLDGDTFTVKAGGMVVQAGTQKFDATKTPKTVDATVTQGQGKGTIMLGIYELDGDTLKICFDPEGKTRPTEFKAAAGSATFVNVHKRVKK